MAIDFRAGMQLKQDIRWPGTARHPPRARRKTAKETQGGLGATASRRYAKQRWACRQTRPHTVCPRPSRYFLVSFLTRALRSLRSLSVRRWPSMFILVPNADGDDTGVAGDDESEARLGGDAG